MQFVFPNEVWQTGARLSLLIIISCRAPTGLWRFVPELPDRAAVLVTLYFANPRRRLHTTLDTKHYFFIIFWPTKSPTPKPIQLDGKDNERSLFSQYISVERLEILVIFWRKGTSK